jgi:NAD(P)-dependent dehydrogenase (short-subunit alcohol dehydrogenase family)
MVHVDIVIRLDCCLTLGQMEIDDQRCKTKTDNPSNVRNFSFLIFRGAASGLGQAIAKILVLRGHKVFAVDKIEIFTTTMTSLICDLSQPACVEQIQLWLTQHAVRQLDTVICNAGVFQFKPVMELDEEEVAKIWQTNVFGVWRTIKATRPEKKLIVISSEGAILAKAPYTWPYVGTKKALEDMATCLALEQPTLNVSIVRPGAMRTPMLQQLSDLKSECRKAKFMWKVAKYSAQWYSSSTDNVAQVISDVVEQPRAPLHINLGHNPLLRLISVFPDSLTTPVLSFFLAFRD